MQKRCYDNTHLPDSARELDAGRAASARFLEELERLGGTDFKKKDLAKRQNNRSQEDATQQLVASHTAVESKTQEQLPPSDKFIVERVEVTPLSPADKERVASLQLLLIRALPATFQAAVEKTSKERLLDADRAVRESLHKNEGFPAVPTSYSPAQSERYWKLLNDYQNESKKQFLADFSRKLEGIEREQKEGIFGPFTRAAYKEYIDWLQLDAVPAAYRLSRDYLKIPLPDSPIALPHNIAPGAKGRGVDYGTFDPRSFDPGKGIVNLGLNTDQPPTIKDLEKLGCVISWMNDTRDSIDEERRNFDRTVRYPDLIRKNGLPLQWSWEYNKTAAGTAYDAAFEEAHNLALKVRNLLTLAIDNDQLNFSQGKSLAEIKRDLHIPNEWEITINNDTKKIASINLDLPKNLCLLDPINKAKMERLQRWLDTTGRNINTAVQEAIKNESNPERFLYWGDVEVPRGPDGKPYKMKDGDGNFVECNLIESRFEAERRRINGKEKIVVTYRIQPQHAKTLSYLNMFFVDDVGKPIVQTFILDPDQFIIVRHGLNSLEMMKADDLIGWRARRRLGHYGEKTATVAMDVGMTVAGVQTVRGAMLAARLGEQEATLAAKELLTFGENEALKLTRGQFMGLCCKGGTESILGLSGGLNNAHNNQYAWVQNFLQTRGLIFTGQVAWHFPGQLKALIGLSSGAKAGSAAYKMEQLWGSEKAAEKAAQALPDKLARSTLTQTERDLEEIQRLTRAATRVGAGEMGAIKELQEAMKAIPAGVAEKLAPLLKELQTPLTRASFLTSRVCKLEQGMYKANHLSMNLAIWGFAPMIFSDIVNHFDERPDLAKDLERLQTADCIINHNEGEDRVTRDCKRLADYCDLLEMAPTSKARAEKIVADTTVLLKSSDQADHVDRYNEAKQRLCNELVSIVKSDETGKDVKLIAAAALLAISCDKDGNLPAAETVARRLSQSGETVDQITRSDLATMLREQSSLLGNRWLLSEELRVLMGDLAAIEYGRDLQRMLDDSDVPETDKRRQWAQDRTDFIAAAAEITFSRYDPKSEFALACSVLNSYNSKLKECIDQHKEYDEHTRRVLGTQIDDICNETQHLLALRHSHPAAFNQQLATFKEKWIALFRTGTGEEIMKVEQDRSGESHQRETINDDDERVKDLNKGGPTGASKELQALAAASLLLLCRDDRGQIRKDAVVAERELEVPQFTYDKFVEYDDGSRQEEITVPKHMHKQILRAEDLIGLLRRDLEQKESGSRRLVEADLLLNCGALSGLEDAAILKGCLLPDREGQHNPSDVRWALERIGFIANANRVIERDNLRILGPDRAGEEKGKMFGVLSSDLISVIKSVAREKPTSNDARRRDNQALSIAVLNALKADPAQCHEQLMEAINEARKLENEPGAFADRLVAKLKTALAGKDVTAKLHAAQSLFDLGELSVEKLNAAALECIERAGRWREMEGNRVFEMDQENLPISIEALGTLRVDDPNTDLTPDHRTFFRELISQPPTVSNIELQLAILPQIDKWTAPKERQMVANIIHTQIFRKPQDFELREAYARALGKVGASDSEIVLQLLADSASESSARVRLAAINSLAELHSTRLKQFLREHSDKETDPAVKARMNDLLFSLPPPDEINLYRNRYETARKELEEFILSKSRASVDQKDVERYLEKAGEKESDGIWGNALLRLTEAKLGVCFRHRDKTESELRGLRLKWEGYAFEQLNEIGRIARSGSGKETDNEDQQKAILVLGYLAMENCGLLDHSWRERAQPVVCELLAKCCQSGVKNREFVRYAIYKALESPITQPESKLILLDGFLKLCESAPGDPPAISREAQAVVLLKAFYSEATRKKDDSNSFEIEKSIEFQKKTLELFEKLMPYGYLGDLDCIALKHASAKIRAQARQMAANMREKFSILWDRMPDTTLRPDQGAERMRNAFKNIDPKSGELQADDVVEEITKACKGKQNAITTAEDPRIPLLLAALTNESAKIKLAAAYALLDPDSTGISREARIAAMKTAGEVAAYAEHMDKIGWIQDAALVAARADGLHDRELGLTFLTAREANSRQLDQTTFLQPGQRNSLKPDLSVLTHDGKNRISGIKYPPSTGNNVLERQMARDQEGTITKTSVLLTDGKQRDWSRQRDTNGKWTDLWTLPDGQSWKGSIEVSPSGTYTETMVAEDGQILWRRICYTNGTDNSITFEKGRPKQITYGNGDRLDVTWNEEGELSSFTFAGYPKTYVLHGHYSDGYDHFIVELDEQGKFTCQWTNGIKGVKHPSGECSYLYLGPTSYTVSAAKSLQSRKHEGPEAFAAAILGTGALTDRNDPRLEIIKQALKDPSPKVRTAAAAMFLSQYSTAVLESTRAEMMETLASHAVDAIMTGNPTLKQEIDELVALLEDDQPFLDTLAVATKSQARAKSFNGKISFGCNGRTLTVVCPRPQETSSDGK